MGFCTKCGQQIIEGQEHICPASYDGNQQQYGGQGSGFGGSQQYGGQMGGQKSFGGQFGRINTPQDSLSSFERGKKIVPDIISANDGEVPIKQYKVAKLRSRITLSKAEGRLQVTNKRLIFRATGRSIMGKVTLHQEFKINNLAGIEFRNRPEFNFFNIFAGLLLTAICAAIGVGLGTWLDNGFMTVMIIIAGIAAPLLWIAASVLIFLTKYHRKFYALRLAILGFIGGELFTRGSEAVSFFGDSDSGIDPRFFIVLFAIVVLFALISLILMAFVPNLVIKVKTSSAHPGIEIVKEEPTALLSFLFGKSHEENSGFLEVLPWTDTDLAIKELGTIIDDINTLGDRAIEKWKED